MNNTVYISGQQFAVTPDNWQSLAKVKLDLMLKDNPNTSNADQLAVFNSFKQLGGATDAASPYSVNPATGAVTANDYNIGGWADSLYDTTTQAKTWVSSLSDTAATLGKDFQAGLDALGNAETQLLYLGVGALALVVLFYSSQIYKNVSG